MNQELLNKMLDITGDAIKNLQTTAPGLLKEVINYFLFVSVMHVIESLFVVLLIALAYKLSSIILVNPLRMELSTMKEATERRVMNTQITVIQSIRLILVVGSAVPILMNSWPNIISIGKAIYAPRIFIMEKAGKFVLDNRASEESSAWRKNEKEH